MEGMVNNMELKDSRDCAEDLLARMMLVNEEAVTPQMIQRNVSKFQSALIIQSMIKGNHIAGHTNQEVYEMYVYCAKEMNIPALSIIDLSRTLCKYYGFTIVDKTINKKKYRIFEKMINISDTVYSIRCAVYYICNILKVDGIDNHKDTDVYDEYVAWCMDNLQDACSETEFTALVTDILKVNIQK